MHGLWDRSPSIKQFIEPIEEDGVGKRKISHLAVRIGAFFLSEQIGGIFSDIRHTCLIMGANMIPYVKMPRFFEGKSRNRSYREDSV